MGANPREETHNLQFPFFTHSIDPIPLGPPVQIQMVSKFSPAISLTASQQKEKMAYCLIDRLGAPGDALITAMSSGVLRRVTSVWKVNCITPRPELIDLGPTSLIQSINLKPFVQLSSTYWELIVRKERAKM